MKTSQNGIDLIKEHEGFSATAYKDQAGLWTIGYGTLIDTADERRYLPNLVNNTFPEISKAEAEAYLRKDIAQFEDTVNQSVAVPLTQNQFDALVSLVYNIGPYNFRQSTVLRKINAQADHDEISRWWKAWDKVTDPATGVKVVSNGLKKRRSQELDLFFLRAGGSVDHKKERPDPSRNTFHCPNCGHHLVVQNSKPVKP